MSELQRLGARELLERLDEAGSCWCAPPCQSSEDGACEAAQLRAEVLRRLELLEAGQ